MKRSTIGRRSTMLRRSLMLSSTAMMRKSVILSKKMNASAFFDIFSVLMLLAILLWIELFVDPYKNGFFCRDETIKLNPKSETLSRVLVYPLAICGPPLLIALCETFIYLKKVPFLLRKMSGWGVRVYKTAGVFLFSVCCLMLIVNVTKHWIGRLSPTFYMICRPQYECNRANRDKYITNYHCAVDSEKDQVRQTRMSFPSGHSALSAFSMTFLIIYIEEKYIYKNTPCYSFFFKRLLQMGCATLALFVGYTRYVDNLRHDTDIIAGFIVGTLAAYLAVFYLSNIHKEPEGEIPHRQSSSSSSEPEDMTVKGH